MGHRGQEPNESTDDAVWQDLVARLEDTTGASPLDAAGPSRADGHVVRPAPDEGPADLDAGRTQPTDRERAEAIFRNQPFAPGGPRDYSAPDVKDGTDEAEVHEGFVPAEPPPLGNADPLTVLAWVGAAGGPVALLLIAMFWRSAPLGAVLGVLAVFLAGAGLLITRLPKHRDMGDDGAEV